MKFKTFLKALAMQSPHHRYLHAAVVVKGKSILGAGVNAGGFHAEANALHRVDGSGAVLYTLMIRKRSGRVGDGSPCAACMKLIRKAKVHKVVVYVG